MEKEFQKIIEGEVPVIVDFYAEWCSVCPEVTPVLERVKRTVGENVTVLKMNVDKNLFYAQKYQVENIPTLFIFKKGKIIWRKAGVVTDNEIFQQLAPHV